MNYHLQTSAIAQNLIVPTLTDRQKTFVYTDEADILNVALFGKTAKEWREQNPDKATTSNMRDYASVHQLLVLSHMEIYNSNMIKDKIHQKIRIEKLNEVARQQLNILQDVDNRLLLAENK